MLRQLVMLLAVPALAVAHDDTLIPMPADVPPHHARFLAGPHHFEIGGNQTEIRHSGDHWISYGMHNYDMSADPSNRHKFPYEEHRYRGMGQGERERFSMSRKSLADIPRGQEEPWVVDRIKRRGLAYQLPEEDTITERDRRAVGFPRPSWYAKYKHQRRVVRR